MTGIWLVSYGLFWLLLSLNGILTFKIARFLIRVRKQWHNDARTYELPFTLTFRLNGMAPPYFQ